ncbi:hypothetical protein [Streptomyces sp. KL118A]|uniref:hypothetical protein n=1 Tax=Streptomyces sp. KL118A TaxID=3045153 RepID=UPI00278C2D41|nr:hypothetical protein [Streptomyces sp. KL118A]
MSTSRRHTLLRTAAVSALAGGALLIPAAGAFADSPAPEPTAPQSPQPTPHTKGEVYEVTLGNGARAKIQNRGGSYVATISLKGKEIATLSATHPTVTQGGVKYELHPSNGHIGITYLKGQDNGRKQQHATGTEHGTGDKTVAPKGGVKAGAEGVRDAGDPAFLVAGGGMAAAGAAGLGFAMLRRGRTDG